MIASMQPVYRICEGPLSGPTASRVLLPEPRNIDDVVLSTFEMKQYFEFAWRETGPLREIDPPPITRPMNRRERRAARKAKR